MSCFGRLTHIVKFLVLWRGFILDGLLGKFTELLLDFFSLKPHQSDRLGIVESLFLVSLAHIQEPVFTLFVLQDRNLRVKSALGPQLSFLIVIEGIDDLVEIILNLEQIFLTFIDVGIRDNLGVTGAEFFLHVPLHKVSSVLAIFRHFGLRHVLEDSAVLVTQIGISESFLSQLLLFVLGRLQMPRVLDNELGEGLLMLGLLPVGKGSEPVNVALLLRNFNHLIDASSGSYRLAHVLDPVLHRLKIINFIIVAIVSNRNALPHDLFKSHLSESVQDSLKSRRVKLSHRVELLSF